MNLRFHIFCGQLLWLVSVLKGKSLQGVPGYGRNLIIKALPAVEDYQSNVYEVYMEPYLYVSVCYFILVTRNSEKLSVVFATEFVELGRLIPT